jgi:hypothetical protein
MERIQLIYFEGCPNYSVVKNLLSDIGVKYEEIEQNDLEETDPLKLFSSPSILKNGKLIFGQKIDSTKGGCTINLPDKSSLAKKLKE